MEAFESNWRPVPDFYERTHASVARTFFRFAVFWLFIGLISGLSYGIQFISGWGEILIPPNPVHSVGRLRVAHSGVLVFGFLINVLLGALHAASSPRSTGEGSGRGAAFSGLWLIQLALLAGVIGVLYRGGQGVPFFELPFWSYPILLLGWFFAAGSILEMVEPGDDEYAQGVFPWVAVAFFAGVLVLSLGGGLRFLSLPQTEAVRWIALIQSALFHLLLVPLAFGSALYLFRFRIPHALWNRIWQGAMAFTVAGAGLMAGQAIYRVTPSPLGLVEFESIADAIYFGIMILFLAGFALALRGAIRDRLEPPPWQSRGMIWFAAGSLALALYAAQRLLLAALPSHLELIRYTDWIVGHHHLLLLLGIGAWCFGLLDEIWPELRRSEGWRFPIFADLHLLLTLIGGWVMVATLFVSGWIQASLIDSLVSWRQVIQQSQPFWLIRVASGAGILLAQFLFLLNFVMTRDRTLPELRQPRNAPPIDPEPVDPELVDPAVEELLR